MLARRAEPPCEARVSGACHNVMLINVTVVILRSSLDLCVLHLTIVSSQLIMSLSVSNYPVQCLAIAGLEAPCLSEKFLLSHGLSVSGSSCMRTLTFRNAGGCISTPLSFAIVHDVRADLVLPAEFAMDRGITIGKSFNPIVLNLLMLL